jgi:hypothetical protein
VGKVSRPIDKIERTAYKIFMDNKELKILLEKVDGGYIVADPNPDPKHSSDIWINKAVHTDFESAMEDVRRRLRVSDIIVSHEGKLSL